jgi:hypothetical protein
MTSRVCIRILRTALCCIFLLLPTLAWGQSQTRALHPDVLATEGGRLKIGPVEGLTLGWHRAPARTAVPVGATITLRVPVRSQDAVQWTGAREVERNPGGSTAEVTPRQPGVYEIRVVYQEPGAAGLAEREERITLEAVAIAPEAVQISGLRATVDEVAIDPADPNASSMHYFFRDDSIAALRQVAPGHVRTSVKRWLTLAVDVEPAGFAPLVEWRLNGAPQEHLGSPVALRVFPPREHTVQVGPEAAPQALTLETYLVQITGPGEDDPIHDGESVTYRAETIPPGFEDEVNWLASTKTGTCWPDRGEGAEFTTVFSETFGAEGRWLGVRGDQAVVGKDGKNAPPVDDPFLCPGNPPILFNPCTLVAENIPTCPLGTSDCAGKVECQENPDLGMFCTCQRTGNGPFEGCEFFAAACVGANGSHAGGPDLGSCALPPDPVSPPPPVPPAPPMVPVP